MVSWGERGDIVVLVVSVDCRAVFLTSMNVT